MKIVCLVLMLSASIPAYADAPAPPTPALKMAITPGNDPRDGIAGEHIKSGQPLPAVKPPQGATKPTTETTRPLG